MADIRLCFMMAKESVAFAKYLSLLELGKRHGVDLGHAYTAADSAKLFTCFIAKSQQKSFFSTLYQTVQVSRPDFSGILPISLVLSRFPTFSLAGY